MLLQRSIERVSIVYKCNTYFAMHWSIRIQYSTSIIGLQTAYRHVVSRYGPTETHGNLVLNFNYQLCVHLN